ncbi:hypothetical protein Xvie_02499 [Xenorhabdus vietnamensis]|uniref:Uncharacterized protein n=1 Tax=Xenorhabdus vietnamensis TaxID=351656 RepID=A0A1Y2SDN9_9GAMM|nr:hypothetical protein [Xenorhabdus vietnamensis]OTA15646.1 hypothetical protein Xvie_02499 [Xenorhabdus vietnamensis]
MNSFLSTDPYNILETVTKFKNEFISIENQYVRDCLISTVKKTLLLKIIHNKTLTNNRYLLSIIYDFLCCISSINLNEERYFYFNLRSSIENIIRFSLDKPNDDETGITRLFTQFKDKYKNISGVSSLSRAYSDACNYVHNNIKAGLDLSKSFSYINGTKNLPTKRLKSLAKELHEVQSSIDEILIANNKADITYTFLYLNESLTYLTNKRFIEKLN